MSLLEYVRANRAASWHVFKVGGIVCTIICLVLWLLFEKPPFDPLSAFGICLLLGNAMSLIFTGIMIGTGQQYYRQSLRLWEEIPSETKARFCLKPIEKNREENSEFLELMIIGRSSEATVFLECNHQQKSIEFTLPTIYHGKHWDDIPIWFKPMKIKPSGSIRYTAELSVNTFEVSIPLKTWRRMSHQDRAHWFEDVLILVKKWDVPLKTSED